MIDSSKLIIFQEVVMTKKQKAELIAQLKEIAVKNGFTLDR